MIARNQDFIDRNLENEIGQLLFWKQIVFGAAICERLLPSYQKFLQIAGLEDDSCLQTNLYYIWDDILGISKRDLQSCAGFLEEKMPETEEFPTVWASLALDSVVAVQLLLQGTQDGSKSNAVAISTLAMDSVDMYAREFLENEANIFSVDDCLESEARIQVAQLRYLTSVGSNKKARTQVRDSFYGKQVSCLPGL